MDDARRAERNLGLTRNPRENDFAGQRRLQDAKADSIKAKQHSSYWLGLVHYDSGNYDSASAWFEQRCLALYPDGPWTAGARYNLARCYEANGEYEKARDLYLADDSAQQHGNLVRAKLITQWTSNDPSEDSE